VPRLTADQLAARSQSIGSSEVAAILGLDSYRTGLDVWLSKRSPDLLVEAEESEAQLMGHLLEPVVAQRYALALPDVSLRESETLVGPEPFMTATPDRIATSWIDGPIVAEADREWIVEIKTKSVWTMRGFGPTGSDEVPPEILCQVLWQQAISGLTERADVAVLVDGREFRLYHIAHDAEVAAVMLDEARQWWQRHMVDGEEPPIEGRAARSYLMQKFAKARPDLIEADEEANTLMREIQRANALITEGELIKDRTALRLMQLCGEAAGIEGPVGKWRWTPQKGRETIDAKALIAHLNVAPEIVQQFTKRSPDIRVPRFYPNKETPHE